jgi:hypothetical protein
MWWLRQASVTIQGPATNDHDQKSYEPNRLFTDAVVTFADTVLTLPQG